MAYSSPQIEGRLKATDTWSCPSCNFPDNQLNLTQCQYCGMERFNPMQATTAMPDPVPSAPAESPQFNHQYHLHSNLPSSSQVFVQYPPAQPSHPQPPPQVVQPAAINANITVNINNNQRNIVHHGNHSQALQQPIINEQYQAYYEEDAYEYETIHCCCSVLRLFLWLTIGGGLVTAIWWFVCGILYCYWFKACFGISKYLLSGLCTNTTSIELQSKCACYDSQGANEQNCCCDMFFVVVWVLLFGIPSAVLHLVFGVISLPFLLCKFRFSVIHFRIAKVALFNPFAVEVKTRD